MSGEPVAVNILDREFLVSCTADERPALLAAARYLDGKMRETRSSARSAGLDRIAILAALNISHELLADKQRESSEALQLTEKLKGLQTKLERAFP